MIADRERRMKYKKQEEARESVRQNLRDKVIITLIVTFVFAPAPVMYSRLAKCQTKKNFPFCSQWINQIGSDSLIIGCSLNAIE